MSHVISCFRFTLSWEAKNENVLTITLGSKSIGDQGMLVSFMGRVTKEPAAIVSRSFCRCPRLELTSWDWGFVMMLEAEARFVYHMGIAIRFQLNVIIYSGCVKQRA